MTLVHSSITPALVMTNSGDRANPGPDLPDWLRGVNPAYIEGCDQEVFRIARRSYDSPWRIVGTAGGSRSEEHTSELQSPDHLLFRLLLVKKKKRITEST